MEQRRRKSYVYWVAVLAAVLICPSIHAQTLQSMIAHQAAPGAVDLKTATIYADPGDAKLVQIAAGLLSEDIQRVSGAKPAVVDDAARLSGDAVIVGTIGHSALIDQLIKDGKFDASGVAGEWETYRIAVVVNPVANVAAAVVIAGSDRRGTAYGVFDLSQAIGVSPWYWWADATPVHQDELYVTGTGVKDGPPSVKYRGIFINDEDWGLEPWAAKTFEKDRGNIGPKTYAKVFELLLRLKGNFLWPAMHPVSTEFGRIAENIKLADDWGIVMGASHTEAMNRNNVLWPKEGTGPWRYDTNRDNVLAYWEAWAKLRGPYEAVWTLGIRGVHDAAMLGPPDVPSRIKIVETAIADQRDLIRKYVNPDVLTVPQLFAPYKEVLTLYQHGLKVPDDVTLLWPDDNFGYIRQLSTPAEQKRAGAAGIYYHISYLGHPRSYTWLDTTPPALIWEEMSKAFDYGANRVWVCNVGDIKPGEIGMEFWLRMGWNVHAYNRLTTPDFLSDFARREFGAEMATPVADVLAEYYRLGFTRKPEAMDVDSFNPEEAVVRHAAYHKLIDDAAAIAAELPADKRDEFYELVQYPVEASGWTSDVFLDAQYGRPIAEDLKQIADATDYYNNQLAGGKWKYMMTERGTTAKPWGFEWPKVAATAPVAEPAAVAGEYDSIFAEHFTRNIPRSGAQWQMIAGLGRQANSVAVFPTTTPSIADVAQVAGQAPELDYDFTLSRGGNAQVTVYAIPTHRIDEGRGLRYAVSIDDETPQEVGFDEQAGDTNRAWGQNVIRNAAVTVTDHPLAAGGKHTLRIFMVDPGVVLEKFVVSVGKMPQSELGPAEIQ